MSIELLAKSEILSQNEAYRKKIEAGGKPGRLLQSGTALEDRAAQVIGYRIHWSKEKASCECKPNR